MPEAIENLPSTKAPPWEKPWPSNELEPVPSCPICGNPAREILHKNLVDNVFFTAPGHWDLYRCLQCDSAYLDPRPDQQSIGKAYTAYYTHDAGKNAKAARKTGLHRLKPALSNGYTNQRYGTHWQPASKLGAWLARWMPRQREKIDAKFRHMPKPTPGQKLLDIGCGNGAFLICAREAGWEVTGIDPDPKAVEAVRRRGLQVDVGSIDVYAGKSNCFDAITLSHVIEHLPEPGRALHAVHRLLKPGGTLFVDTPNIKSKGAKSWGNNWRGLETPRHLVIFSPSALVHLLETCGFENICIKRRKSVRKSIYLDSLRMQRGASPYSKEPARLPLLMRLRLKYSIVRAEDDEFLTLVASKPRADR